jgi:hypothetical protein
MAFGSSVGLYGMVTNMEMKEVDMPLLIVSGGMLLFSRPTWRLWGRTSRRIAVRTAYARFLFCLLVSSLALGATRYRVLISGRDAFYRGEEVLPVIPSLLPSSTTINSKSSPQLTDAPQTWR